MALIHTIETIVEFVHKECQWISAWFKESQGASNVQEIPRPRGD